MRFAQPSEGAGSKKVSSCGSAPKRDPPRFSAKQLMNNTISDGGWVPIGADRDPCASNIFEPFQYFMAREGWVPLRRRFTSWAFHHAGKLNELVTRRDLTPVATKLKCPAGQQSRTVIHVVVRCS